MHDHTKYLVLIFFAAFHILFLSACITGHISYQEPAFSENEVLDSLIGAQKTEVLKKLGSPEQLFTKKAASYYLYTGHAKGIPFILTPLPIPVPYSESIRYCTLLMFDANGILDKYFEYNVGGKLEHNRCEEIFKEYVQDDLQWLSGVEPASVQVLLTESGLGNAAAQWELYNSGKSSGKYDLKLLCEAAENGNTRAQWELGYLHCNGQHGVPRDLMLGVMWYGLVESAGYNPVGVENIRKQLTPEQLTEAEHLYDNWKPGQCERVLIGTGRSIEIR